MRRLVRSAWAGTIPAAALSALYLIWQPPSADLAAQTFRADQFAEHGFEVWSNAWYAGFHLPGYSLLYPPLAALLGTRLVGAIAVVAAAAAFGLVAERRYGERAALAIWLFGAGAATNLFTGRLTFALGVAFALAAILALDRDRRALGAGLALATSLASPVAGLFLALAGAALALARLVGGGGEPGEASRRGVTWDAIAPGALLAVPALGGIAVLALAFPTGGIEPFATNTFKLIVPAVAILIVALPAEERAIRIGAGLYLVACLAFLVADTPVGGNFTRLGALMAAPLLALGAAGRRPGWLVGLLLVPLLYWQWVAPVRDVRDAIDDPTVEAAYYDPLLATLEAEAPPAGSFRVEVTPTRNRWEAVHVAERYPLARGWLRQLESDDFELFQDGNLDAGSYRDWLDRRGVAYVAIPLQAQPDYLATDEIALIESGLPFLTPIHSDPNWQVYAIDDPAPLVSSPAREVSVGESAIGFEAPAAGTYTVAVNDSPYWTVTEGDACVAGDEDGVLALEVAAPGRIELQAGFSLAGLGRSGADRCG